jgi:thiol-disulfide isomerase/thioredoxin
MKTVTLALSLALAGIAHADVIHLSSGKDINGTVSGYANMTFEITVEGTGDMRQSAAAIKSIEFTPRPAKFEVRGRGAIEGTLTSYEAGSFTVQKSDGKTEKLQSMMVSNASFGGSGKKFINFSGGGVLDLKKVIVPGKITIVDFHADWCGPCKQISPHLDKINKDDPDVVLRKVDIVKLGTPVTKQFDIKSIPRIHIYDRTGKLVGSVTGAGKDAVDTYLKAAKGAK